MASAKGTLSGVLSLGRFPKSVIAGSATGVLVVNAAGTVVKRVRVV